MKKVISRKVHDYYWIDNFNCAHTTLRVLSEIFKIELTEQVVNSSIGMQGAGRYGAQCGIVEAALMMMGILGKENELSDEDIVKKCRSFAGRFEKQFGSLVCKILRPEGFKEGNPPHLCEELTKKGVLFSAEYIKQQFKQSRSLIIPR